MASMSSNPKIERQISLPMNAAIRIALKSITIRFGRALVTGAGTMLGIAFMMSVFTGGLVRDAKKAEEDKVSISKTVQTEAAQTQAAQTEAAQTEAAQTEAVADPQQQKNTWLIVMSLLVCVVGITNSMLMSVTERFKEIGTMKCLGALDSFIVRLFLIESALLGFFGSLIGTLVGGLFMLLTAIGYFGYFSWGKFLLYIGACILVGTILSVVAAVPPAMRAAKMQAADAMRSEI